MAQVKLALDERGKKLAAQCGISEDKVKAVAAGILEAAAKNNLDLSKDVVIGLDVNGPVVAVDNNDLMPLPFAKDAVEYMMGCKGVHVSLMTGWDLSSMTFFRNERLGLDRLGIVERVRHGLQKGRRASPSSTPTSEKEAFGFIRIAIDIAADRDLKFAIQGNYSSGVGPLIVEADHNGHLFEHPLVKGRRPTIEKLFEEAKKGGSKVELKGGKVVFENKVDNLKGVFESLAHKHPLTSVRWRRVKGDMVSFELDADDKPGFDFPALQKIGEILTERTGRRCMVYEDFGIDCFAKEVDAGDYYKQAGLHAYGKDILKGADFVKIIVGDKANDAPKVFEGTLFCPMAGTQAAKYADEKSIPHSEVGDVRDFALAMCIIRAACKSGCCS